MARTTNLSLRGTFTPSFMTCRPGPTEPSPMAGRGCSSLLLIGLHPAGWGWVWGARSLHDLDLRRRPGQPDGIMTVRVPPTALSSVRSGLRLAGPAGPVIGIQGQRVACPT